VVAHGDTSRPRVLLGFAEAASAPEAVWSLVDAGFDVLAFARKGRGSALRRSRHVACVEIRSPEADVFGALSDLAAVLASLDGPTRVLFPLDDLAVWLSNRVTMPEGGLIVGPTGDAAQLALNKELQVQAAIRAGLAVPRTSVVRTSQELRTLQRDFPLILKPAQCAVLIGDRLRRCRSWIVGNATELDRAVAEWAERAPLLVQPFIEGVGEGVFGLAAPEGVRAWSGHRRLRMMNPHGSGSSACTSREVSDDLKRAVQILVEQTGWRGLFMVELLRDASGRPWFVELNGRPWGSMALARRQGLEYPAWQVALTLDSQSAAGRVTAGAAGVVCRHLGRELMHLLFVLRGPRSSVLRRWPSAWRALGAVVAIRPGDAFYNWRRDDPAVFISDCYHAVRDNVFKRES
jgi:hypothetical protein